MANSDPDKVDFLAFTKAEFSISSTFSSPTFYIAFLLSFGVFVLIALSVIRKNQRYKKQGFLATEKSELKIMLDDIRSSVVISSQNKKLDNKNLFQLFTESDSTDILKHPEGGSTNNSVFKKQAIHKNNNHSSSKDSTSKSTDLNKNNNKKPLRKQNPKQQKKKTQTQDNSIHIHKGQISFSQSLSERLPKVQQQKQNTVILSDKKNNFTSSVKECRNVSGITEDQEYYVKENQSDLTQNEEQESHKTSAICSFASLSRPNNLLPGMDSSQLVNVSANYSTIITPSHTQKLMESSPQNSVIIVLADEKHAFQNDNQDNHGEKNKEEQSTQLQQEYLPTQMLCITANNINNENQLTQIAPLNCSQNQNNCEDAHVIQFDDENQITRIQEKEKNNGQAIRLSSSTLSRKNTDLSVSKANSLLTSNIKPTSFFKEISRLCFRHNMFLNTLKEDSVLFPRVLKCVIIHCNVCLLLLAGSFVQIYYYNSEISHLKDKSTELISFSKVNPSSSPESFLREFSLSFEVALFLIAGSMGLTVFSKSDPEIVFINNNNQQLQRNLLEVRSNQSYKIFFSCFFAFVLSAFCFVQFFAFFQVLPSGFILRWALISFIVFLLIFMIFDIFYFSFLIILRFRSSFSPRCLHLYSMLLSKAAWWAL